MKLKLFFAALAASALCACSEQAGMNPVSSDEVPGTVELEISLSSGKTKVVNNTQEENMKDVQILVFNEDDMLETFRYFQLNQKPIKVGAFNGKKKVYAVVNAPDLLTEVTTFADFSSKIARLDDNKLESLIMTGCQEIDVNGTNLSLTIPVERLISKVTLLRVTNMLSSYYTDVKFHVGRVYLINVVGNTAYADPDQYVPQEKDWFNKMTYPATDNFIGFTCGSFNLQLAYSKYTETVHSFYCYPNPTVDDSSSQTWSPRHTKLVVEVKLNETLYYYSIAMPVMKRNTEYQVSLTITGPGSNRPDVPYNPDVATFEIVPVGWHDGVDFTTTI